LDFDPDKIDEELAAMRASDALMLSISERTDAEDDAYLAELMEKAQALGFTVAEDLPTHLKSPEGDVNPLTFYQFDLLGRKPEFQERIEPYQVEIVKAFSKLVRVKGWAATTAVVRDGHDVPEDLLGRTDAQTLKSRNEAIGIIFDSVDIDDDQKDAFLMLANSYLEGLVEPFVLPTAISPAVKNQIKAEIGEQIVEDMEAEHRFYEHNGQIDDVALTGIETALRNAMGEHDDLDSMAWSVLSAATQLLKVQRQQPDFDRSDDELGIMLLGAELQMPLERLGQAPLIELIKTVSQLMDELDYQFREE
jgi:hypothetical protein